MPRWLLLQAPCGRNCLVLKPGLFQCSLMIPALLVFPLPTQAKSLLGKLPPIFMVFVLRLNPSLALQPHVGSHRLHPAVAGYQSISPVCFLLSQFTRLCGVRSDPSSELPSSPSLSQIRFPRAVLVPHQWGFFKHCLKCKASSYFRMTYMLVTLTLDKPSSVIDI